jgi:hypothetical protein
LDRDLILVDNGITPRDRAIVVVVMDGELLIKRYRKVGDRVWLEPDPVGEDTPNIEIGDGGEAMSQHTTLDEALDYWRRFSAELSAPGFADDLVIVDSNGYLVMTGDVLFAA